MRFGTPVLVHRGGGSPPGTPGCTRTVAGVLVGRFGHQCRVRLTEDDPLDTVGWRRVGDVGVWDSSAVDWLRDRAADHRKRAGQLGGIGYPAAQAETTRASECMDLADALEGKGP